MRQRLPVDRADDLQHDDVRRHDVQRGELQDVRQRMHDERRARHRDVQ
jgi:hypothetical protein